jgi:hypothetical protein
MTQDETAIRRPSVYRNGSRLNKKIIVRKKWCYDISLMTECSGAKKVTLDSEFSFVG